MNEPHPVQSFAGPLKDLAEGRMEPDAWIAWWTEHAGEVEAICPRGWFLKLKPKQLESSGANRAALISQDGACAVLEALNMPFVRSDRYEWGWNDDFRRFREQEQAQSEFRAREFIPRIALLAEVYPKFARFLKKRVNDIDGMEEPATEGDITLVERTLEVQLPAAYRAFLRCTRGLRLEGFSIGLDETGPHPAVIPGQEGPASAIKIAEYWLEADGDQVLLERAPNSEPDPPVYYYAHEAGTDTARRLASSFSGWMESLARSQVFRE